MTVHLERPPAPDGRSLATCRTGTAQGSGRDLLHQEYRVWPQRPIWGLDPNMRKPTLATQILAINALLIVATGAAAIVAARLSLDDVAAAARRSCSSPAS